MLARAEILCLGFKLQNQCFQFCHICFFENRREGIIRRQLPIFILKTANHKLFAKIITKLRVALSKTPDILI